MQSISVVRRPFRVGHKMYLPGDVIADPGTVPFFTSKRRDGKIAELTEHNLQELATYMILRQGTPDAEAKLNKALEEAKYSDPAYIEKVTKLADKQGVDMAGKSIKDVVEELKATKKG